VNVRTPDPVERLASALFGLAALLALVAHVRIDGSLIDDALITFRYAANLADGLGLVYNPGEPVLGTTTPGWAVLLGGIGAVVGADAVPVAARLLNGVLLVLAGAVVVRATRRLTGTPLVAAAAGALIVLAPHTLLSSVAGMESTLSLLLVLTALAGLFERRWLVAAGAAGIAPLVRPEGALVSLVVAAAWLLRRSGGGLPTGTVGDGPVQGLDDARARSSHPVRTLGIAALLALPSVAMVAATWIVYGSPLPHSIRAKQAGIYPLTLGESARETVVGLRGVLTGAGLLDRPLTGLYLAGLAGGTVWLLRRRARLWPLTVLLWGTLVFYAASRTTIFPHYLALVEPFALVAWGCALYAAGAGAVRFASARLGSAAIPPPPGALGLVALSVGVFLLVRPVTLYPLASVAAGAPVTDDPAVSPPMLRMTFYEVAADVVGPAIPAGTTVLMPEIGELGFRLRHVRVLDAAGLVSPEAVPFLPVPASERVGSGVGAIPSGLVRSAEPELVMTLELFARRSVYDDPWFDERYVTVWRWADPGLVWGPLRIHARRDFEAGLRLRELEGGVASGSR